MHTIIEKKLIYRKRDRAMRYIRYGVRKFSISKSNLQSHSRALAMVPFDRQLTISKQSCLSCTFSEILSLISQNSNRSRDLEHILSGVIYHLYTSSSTPLYHCQHTTFEVHSFDTDSKDMIVVTKHHVTMTMPIGVVGYPKASI